MEIFKKLLDEKNKRILLTVSLILLIAGGYFTYRLFSNVRADAESLLPSDSRIMKDMRISRNRLPTIDCLLIFVFSDSPEGSMRFVQDFAKKLREDEHSIISRVVYNIKDEIEFFSDYSPLYYPYWRLEEVRDELFPPDEKEQFVNEWKRRLLRLKKRFDRKIESDDKYSLFKYLKYLPDGNLASRDGKTRALILFYSKPMSDVDDAIKLDKYIKGAIDDLDPSKYAGNMYFRYSGLANTLMNEYYALWDDLTVSITITATLVILLLFFFYKTPRIVVPLMYVLLVGISITFAIAYFAFKQLNANSAFMSSIIIGNAINPGVILCSYYLNERKKLRPLDDSILYAVKMSLKPTLIGALASAVAFGSLIQSDSKGFFDFGAIGLWGMSIGWLCTYIFLPPLLTLKPFQLRDEFLSRYEIPFISLWVRVSAFIFRAGKRVAVGCALVFVVSFVYLLVIDYEYIERDTTKMRSSDYVNTNFRNFQRYLSKIQLRKEMFPSLLILTDTVNGAYRLQQAIEKDKKLKKVTGDLTTFTIFNVIPDDQQDKLDVIREIKKKARRLPDDLSKINLSKRKMEIFVSILDTNVKDVITIDKLPEKVKDYFTEMDGSLGKMVFISVDLNELERDIYLMIDFIDRLNELSAETLGEDNYNTTGIIPISTELAKMMIKDASRCVGFAFGAILFIFFIFYRKLRLFPMMVLNFCFAMSIFIVIIPLFGIKINFLNFIAIPMTFGIGIDYSSNIIQNVFKREEESEKMKRALESAGPFVIVASLTTIIGYSSLIFTKTMALSSFGLLCLVGEIITLLGALLILPGLYAIFYGDRKAAMT